VITYLLGFGRIADSGDDVPPELDVLFDELETDATRASSDEDSLDSHGMPWRDELGIGLVSGCTDRCAFENEPSGANDRRVRERRIFRRLMLFMREREREGHSI
jgi:hypothetical protein